MPYTIDDLRPIISRVRTDITAIKAKDGASIWKRNEPLTSERIEAHLSGQCLRGVCPIKEGESTTLLALFDLDSHKGETSEDEMLAVAQKLWDEANVLGVYFEGFKSSGGNGVHLIAVWDEPQDAYSVRELMMDILMAAGFNSGTGGVAKGEIEIFPKQSSVPMGGCGNQFILPYSPKGEPIATPEWKPSKPVALRERPAPKPKSAAVFESGSDLDEAASAVQFIPCEDYHTWVDIGFALQDRFGDQGFDIWDSWSSQSPKYNAREMRRKWGSFRNTGITIATLFDRARSEGWKPAPVERPVIDTSIVESLVKKLAPKAPPLPLPECKLALDPLALPGLIGDTVRWICSDAMFPQPMLALLNVLAFAGAVYGRRYASPINTRTNAYFVGVASTGAGKDHSRKKMGLLAEASNLGQFIGAHAIISDTGLARALCTNPSQMLMIDEFGKFMQAIADKNAGAWNKKIVKLMMNLYSDSSGVYKHGDYANPKVNEAVVIHSPNLCVYGTTTEKEYIKALNKDAVESGELNRIIAIKVPSVERQQVDFTTELDGDLVDAWGRFSPDGASLGVLLGSASVPPEPIVVGWGDCKALQWSIALEQDKVCATSQEVAPLWNRRHENIIKIAMMFAIARNKSRPEFDKRDFEIATEIMDGSIKYMAGLVHNNLAENDHERAYIEILEYIRAAGDEGVTKSKLFQRFRKFKRRDAEELVGAMIEQELVLADRVVTNTKAGVVYKIM